MALHPDTAVGPVALTARDPEGMARFYERSVGLRRLAGDGGRVALGVGERPLVELVADADARPRPPGSTGLFHLAILVPDRPELGRALLRIAATGAPLVGASDHLVSEALYVSDPEGNGIEIYRDRPRSEWSRDGEEIAMATLPLDLRDVAATTGEQAPERGMDDAARIGHVHLNVADLDEAERFYGQVLGFDVTARGYPGALFLAAGGYHHHVGLNVWAGKGAPPPPAGAAGLRAFEIELADGAELEAATERLREAGVAFELEHGILTTEDPSRNRIVLRARR